MLAIVHAYTYGAVNSAGEAGIAAAAPATRRLLRELDHRADELT